MAGQVYGNEIRKLVLYGEETVYKDPTPPASDAGTGEVEAYKLEFREVRDEKKRYVRHKGTTYRLVYGLCSTSMRDALESSAGYAELEKELNVAGLLARIKALTYGMDDEQYEPWIMQASFKKLAGLVQAPNETLADFRERFDSQLAVTESVYGPLTPTKFKGKPLTEQAEAREKFLTCLFMAATDRGKFKPVIDELCNDYQKAKDKSETTFPATRADAVKLLTKRRGDDKKSQKKDDFEDGVNLSFFQGRPTGRRKRNGKKCPRCGKWGHKARECRATEEEIRERNGPADDNRSHASAGSTASRGPGYNTEQRRYEWSG